MLVSHLSHSSVNNCLQLRELPLKAELLEGQDVAADLEVAAVQGGFGLRQLGVADLLGEDAPADQHGDVRAQAAHGDTAVEGDFVAVPLVLRGIDEEGRQGGLALDAQQVGDPAIDALLAGVLCRPRDQLLCQL